MLPALDHIILKVPPQSNVFKISDFEASKCCGNTSTTKIDTLNKVMISGSPPMSKREILIITKQRKITVDVIAVTILREKTTSVDCEGTTTQKRELEIDATNLTANQEIKVQRDCDGKDNDNSRTAKIHKKKTINRVSYSN